MFLENLIKISGLLSPILLVWITYLYQRKRELEQQVAGIKRENYKSFFAIILKIIAKGKDVKPEDFVEEMRNFASNLILFGSPEIIRTFNSFMIYCAEMNQEASSLAILKYVGKLIKAMRADIGLQNYCLRYYEVLQPFIKGNLKKELKKRR